MKPSILILIGFIFFSCKNKMNYEGGHTDRSGSKSEHRAMIQVSDKPDQQHSITDRKLIKNGYLEISIADIAETKTAIEKICKENQAYISSETQRNYPERLQYEQVIRISAGSFDALVQKVEALSTKVESKNIQTTDVTEEFIDKEARLKTKKELENRYLEILKQAKVVSDILSIEAQLNHVRADIEAMEGRLNYLRNQVAFSTLTLTFYQPIGTQFGFGSKILSSFVNGWDMLLIFIVGLLNIWPFILMATAIIYFVLRRARSTKAINNINSGI